MATAARPQALRAVRALIPRRYHSTTSSTSSSSSTPFSSIHPDEVAHFDALASSWWDPHGPSRILHLMNPIRHDFIRGLRERGAPPTSTRDGDDARTKGLRYLDIGCGGGIFAESAARLADTAHVTGIDPSREVLGVARAHARQDPALSEGVLMTTTTTQKEQEKGLSTSPPPPSKEPRLRYLSATIESLPLPTSPAGQFDVVSLFEVLEHVSSPETVLARAAPFVRPGGWLVGSTIARTWASWLTTKVLAEDLLRVVPRGTHDWGKYIDSEELRGMLEGRGGVEEEEEEVVVAEGKEGRREWRWGNFECMGVVYLPGAGWIECPGGEKLGNYFFAARKELVG